MLGNALIESSTRKSSLCFWKISTWNSKHGLKSNGEVEKEWVLESNRLQLNSVSTAHTCVMLVTFFNHLKLWIPHLYREDNPCLSYKETKAQNGYQSQMTIRQYSGVNSNAAWTLTYGRARPGLSQPCFQGLPKDLSHWVLLWLGWLWTFSVLRPTLLSTPGWGGSQVSPNSGPGCEGLKD